MQGTKKADWLVAMALAYPVAPAPLVTWDNLEVGIPIWYVTSSACQAPADLQTATPILLACYGPHAKTFSGPTNRTQ
jgi:hypothetical protein